MQGNPPNFTPYHGVKVSMSGVLEANITRPEAIDEYLAKNCEIYNNTSTGIVKN